MDDKAYAATLAISRTLVAEDRVTPGPPPEPDPGLARGQTLGRYVVLEKIGAGGMGVVHVAYDPELDRKVAIKILGRPAGDPAGPLGAARLLREAKALARLAHPNVVAVHDAGQFEGRVFVAMEFVPGVTLRQHLSQRTWPWRRVLELFLAAGRGLQAAHAAGLVHRDFKPDNVLVGEDGRVRVLDFGLARASEAAHDDPTAGEPAPPRLDPRDPISGSLSRSSAPQTLARGAGPPSRSSGAQTSPSRAPARDPADPLSPTSAPQPSPSRAPARDPADDPLSPSLAPQPGASDPAGALAPSDPQPSSPGPSASSSALSAELASLASLDSRLTQAGAIVGTPAYMAPEQYLGRPLDARSDQFSFCVALWEALFGAHPFGEGGALALMQAITRGRLRQVPKDRRTPAWLPRALARGMSMSPARRWPDIGALLDELERRARRARRTRIGGAVGLVVGLLLGAGLWGYARSDSQPDACRAAAARLHGAWDPARREAVRDALLATGRAHARATADRVVAALDGYAASWAAMRKDACLATHARREQSEELLDLRMTCLDERRRELAALVDLLERSAPEAVDRAVQAAAALTPLQRCADPAALTAPAPPPDDPDVRVRLQALRQRLAEAKAMLDAGRLAAGLAAAEDTAAAAERLGYRPLVAEALYTLGLLQNRAKDPKLAEATLTRAALTATATRQDDLAARAMIELVACVGVYQARFAEADRWSDLAAAMLERIGPQGHVLAAKRLAHSGLVAQLRGEFAAARALHEQALALLDRPDRPDPAAQIGTLSNLGNTLAELGLHADAEAHHRRAVALAEELFGPDHPQVATLLNNLGAALADTGRDDEAARLHARALTIKERALGPDHLSVGASLRNIAQIRLRQGALSESQALLRRALAIRERTLGPDHPDLAELLHDLGEVARREHRLAAAEALLRRALAVAERGGAEHPIGPQILLGIGRTLLDEGKPDAARDPLRRALAREPPGPPARPAVAANLRLTLADALWTTPQDRPEARALAEQARALLTGDPFAEARAAVDRWLSDHPAPVQPLPVSPVRRTLPP